MRESLQGLQERCFFAKDGFGPLANTTPSQLSQLASLTARYCLIFFLEKAYSSDKSEDFFKVLIKQADKRTLGNSLRK
jgi:hypothetical protein